MTCCLDLLDHGHTITAFTHSSNLGQAAKHFAYITQTIDDIPFQVNSSARITTQSLLNTHEDEASASHAPLQRKVHRHTRRILRIFLPLSGAYATDQLTLSIILRYLTAYRKEHYKERIFGNRSLLSHFHRDV